MSTSPPPAPTPERRALPDVIERPILVPPPPYGGAGAVLTPDEIPDEFRRLRQIEHAARVALESPFLRPFRRVSPIRELADALSTPPISPTNRLVVDVFAVICLTLLGGAFWALLEALA